MSEIRRALGAAALASLAACAGGPGVHGPEAVALFASYSGGWVLDAEGSDAVPASAGPAARGSGADPFGGGGAGRGAPPPGGGGARGGRGGPGGAGGGPGFDPQAMRAAFEMVSLRPPRIDLELTDSTFAASYTRRRRTEVPMSGDEVDLMGRDWPTRARVAWDHRVPRLEWSVAGGGKVTDRYELAGPNRLLLRRVFKPAVGRRLEMSFAYDREAAR